ncbi:hypothetical protein F511_12157 [Dorcoceras hygrometricum]|uniref:DUF1985 domain-containing protein n=1 Tax=Dorcoceras hygrometricum TaxID=472368 RepID=A0A2Z7AXA0_9LAMI|nr:hypothetical protein F511_12157 [Dorcoceras hygrometricum]
MSTVTLVDLRARIDEFEGEIEVEVDVEKIKLASLYFASAVLAPRRKRKKEEVDPQWMRLVDDMNSFNTYPWGRLVYEEALFGLRKDLGARFEEFTNLVKKWKRDPKFSRFASLHLSGCLPAFYEIVTTQILLAEPLGSLALKMVQVRQLVEDQQVKLESADGWRCVYPRPTFSVSKVVLF